MIQYAYFLAALLFVFVCPLSQADESGWVDFGAYQEIETTRKIDYMKVSNDKKFLYLLCDSILEKRDIETGILMDYLDFKNKDIYLFDMAGTEDAFIFRFCEKKNNYTSYISDIFYATFNTTPQLFDNSASADMSRLRLNPLKKEAAYGYEDGVGMENQNGSLEVYNTTTGKRKKIADKGWIQDIAYSDDGRYFAFAEEFISLTEYENYTRIHGVYIKDKYSKNLDTLSWSESNAYISDSDDDQMREAVQSLVFSNKNKFIAYTEGREYFLPTDPYMSYKKFPIQNHLIIVNMNDKSRSGSYYGYHHDNAFIIYVNDITDVIFSSDDEFIITAGNIHYYNENYKIKYHGSIGIRDIDNNIQIDKIDSLPTDKDTEISLALHPNGDAVLAGFNNYVRLYKPKALRPGPFAYFNSNKTVIQTGDELYFNNYSKNYKYCYWEFGDKAISYEENPTHIYEAPGKYDVKLIVGDGKTEDTLMNNNMIEVKAMVKADFSESNIKGPFPLRVYFTNQSKGEVDSCLWDFGDGAISKEQNPVHIYETPGRYSVKLIVNNEAFSDTLVKNDVIYATRATIKGVAVDFEKEFHFGDYHCEAVAGYQVEAGIYKFNSLSTKSGYNFPKHERQSSYVFGNVVNFTIDDRILWNYKHTDDEESSSAYPFLIKEDDNNSSIIYSIGNNENEYSRFSKMNSAGETVWAANPSSDDFCWDICKIAENKYAAIGGDSYGKGMLSIIENNSIILQNEIRNVWKVDKGFRKGIIQGYQDTAIATLTYCRDINYDIYTLISIFDTTGSLLREIKTSFEKNFFPTGMIQLSNGDFIVSGYWSYDDDYKAILYRINNFGDTLWTYKPETNDLMYMDICLLDSLHIAVTGENENNCFYTIFDLNGSLIEDVNFGDGRPGHFNSISRTNDGGLLLVGTILISDTTSNAYIVKTKTIITNPSAVETAKPNAPVKCYPNPADDIINLEFNSQKAGPMELTITNSRGSVLYQKEKPCSGAGMQTARIKTQSWPAGVYYYKLLMNGQVYTGSFVVL